MWQVVHFFSANADGSSSSTYEDSGWVEHSDGSMTRTWSSSSTSSSSASSSDSSSGGSAAATEYEGTRCVCDD